MVRNLSCQVDYNSKPAPIAGFIFHLLSLDLYIV